MCIRDSVIAALTGALAPQHPSVDVNVKDSGQHCAPAAREGEVQVAPADRREQGDEPPFMPNPSIKVTPTVDEEDGGSSEVKSYAGCLQNKYYLPPEAAHEYAATLGMVVDNDCELGSEANGEAAVAEDGEAAESSQRLTRMTMTNVNFMIREAAKWLRKGPLTRRVPMLCMMIMIMMMTLMPCLMVMSRK